MSGITIRYLEDVMRRALLASVTAFAIVFVSGVLYDWTYALLIGFVLAFIVWISGRKNV